MLCAAALAVASFALIAVVAVAQPANRLPVAVPGGPYHGVAGMPVTLDGSASHDPDGSVVAWVWQFGDGTQSASELPRTSKVFMQAGAQPVLLRVRDDRGAWSAPNGTTVQVGPGPSTVIVEGRELAAGSVTLEARLVTGVGLGIEGRNLTFSVGGRVAGHGTTNATGHGAVDWTPRRGGEQVLSVRFPGDASFLGAESNATLQVPEPPGAPTRTPAPGAPLAFLAAVACRALLRRRASGRGAFPQGL